MKIINLYIIKYKNYKQKTKIIDKIMINKFY